MSTQRVTPVRRFNYFYLHVYAIAISLFVATILMLSIVASDAAAPSPYTSPSVVATTSATWVPELPVRLIIPAIEVDAVVQYVGLDVSGSGEMGVPSNFTDVGWYEPGVQPGMNGSAVMAGHYNGKDVAEAVFFDLHTLVVGDEVVVRSAERIEDIFRVVRVEQYEFDEATDDIFTSTDGKKRLNLITCSGVWLPEYSRFDKRTVVFTELVTDVE